jgi:hypothetical protein
MKKQLEVVLNDGDFRVIVFGKDDAIDLTPEAVSYFKKKAQYLKDVTDNLYQIEETRKTIAMLKELQSISEVLRKVKT